MNFAPITITRTHNLISIAPVSYAPCLISCLTWQKQVRDSSRRRTQGKRGKAFYTVEPEPLYRLTDHELITFAGFRFKVYDILSQYAPITYKDDRDPQWLFPPYSVDNLGAFKHGQLEALQTVWGADGGVIDCSTGWGKTEEIAKICASYSGIEDYKIVVVAPGLDIMNAIIERLSKYGVDAGQVDGSHNRRRQVTVCSARSLMKLEDNGDLQKTRLCLFDEVHRCAAPTTRQALIRMDNARLFGLSATVEGRSDKGDIIVEALFGRRICTVTYEDAVAHDIVAPMHVIMVDTQGPAMDYDNPTSKTRHGIWRNSVRNNMWAMIAAQLVEMGQVLILTETLEHATNIFKLLPPGWQLVYDAHPSVRVKSEQRKLNKALAKRPEVSGDSFPSKPPALRRAEKLTAEFESLGLQPMTKTRRNQLAEQFAAGQIRGAVSTKVWSTGVDFPGLQFVIRVDGSASEISSGQDSGRGSRKTESVGKAVGIVLDGEDKFDKSLERRKQSRVRVYKRNKWTIMRGVQPVEVPTICQQILSQYQGSVTG